MRITKRVCSLLLALLMMISLLPAPALAEAPETEEPAPAEEPAPVEEANDLPAEEPEAAPAPADEPEVSYSLRGHALTYNERGVYDANLTGGTVTVSASSASSGQTVKCKPLAASGYRLVAVFFGPSSGAKTDVTETLSATMQNENCAFFAVFIAENGTMPCGGASLRIAAPGLGGSYSGTVGASLTKYYTDLTNNAPTALGAYSVVSAVWKEEGGANPTSFQIGKSYYVEAVLTPNSGWAFPSSVSNVEIQLTMPNGSKVSSANGAVTVSRQLNGNLLIRSPLYTIPETTGWHNLYANTFTYDENGDYDASLTGGTVTVSTGCAQEGSTVSCTVTPNEGYTLLAVQFALPDDEPVADVTDTLQAVMPDRDMEFRAYFVKDGGSRSCYALAVQLENPAASGYTSLPAAPVLTPYLSMTSMAIFPSAFSVTDASWRSEYGNCIGWFYDVRDYYALFTLRPNPGWTFADNCLVELTLPDGSILRSSDGDFTATPNADGSITVKSPLLQVPSTAQPTGGAIPVVFEAEVYDANYHIIPDVIGGTASYSPANPHPGDTVTVTATPAPGYQLQYVYYDDGVRMGYDATPEMSFTVPEDYGMLELYVCFTPTGTVLPLPRSMSLILDIPQPGENTGTVHFGNLEGSWYDLYSARWLGGEGSGCVGQEPASFRPGAKYYVEIVLEPHEHWYWKADTDCLLVYRDPSDPDSSNIAFSGGCTLSVDSEGRLHIVGEEFELPTANIATAELTVQMFEEGGEYPQGCPVVFDLPENAPFTVSDAIWYNYANQESGGIGLAAGFFIADGRYFTEFDLIPNEGYVFTEASQINLTNGSVEIKTLNSDGSIHVVTSWYSLNPEAAAQQRRVFVTNYVMNADGSVNASGSGGYMLPNDNSPKVGDTLIFSAMPKNGYRLQWMTAARDPEQVGEDITNSLEFYVADEPGDVYVHAFFALADEPVTCSTVDLNVQLPAPGGNYSGLAPATVTPNAVNASKYTVVSARWYELQEHGVGTPSSFVPGEQYCVEILLAPNPGWCFSDDPGAFLLFSDGTGMDSRFGEVTPYKQSDGNLVLTSNFITLPETEIDSVELSLDLPELGSSFEAESRLWATFYTPHVGEMYTLWKNGADQATGEKDSVTASFQPGCVYYATVRMHADQGYALTADTQVTLRNGLSFTTEYLATDGSLWLHTESIEIPTDSYQLSGSYVKFRLNDVEVTSARPGDYVVVRADITTQPEGVYLANVTSDDVELKQLTELTWGFAMPAKDVSVTGELLPQETYIFELEDGVHEMNAKDALWLFGEQEAGTRLERDLDDDGSNDIYIDFYDDGTARVVRCGTIYGDREFHTPSGRIGTMIYRFGPERYDVYLGSVQVNADNKDDIPVLGGKASYDPDTCTLHLEGYTGSIGVLGQDTVDPDLTRLFSITASGDLTVTGSGVLLDDSLRGGISCGGNLTLDGDFVIHAWLHGIYAAGDLTVSGNVKVHNTTQVGVGVGGTLRVFLGSLRVEADEGIGVDCRGTVIVAGDLFTAAGEAGLQGDGEVRLVGGTLWASSQNDIGLICTGALNIQNGGLTAYGNIQAVEAGSISYPDTHFIRMPENGTVSADGSTVIDPETGDPAQDVQITDRNPTIILGVKDLEGNENVGGTVDFNDGDFQLEQSGSYPYGTWITVRARAAEGYRFDHWEDAYGGSPGEDSGNPEMDIGIFVDNALYAVFEKLLPIDETTFPDANFRAYILENIDTDGDGWLSRAERQAVTSMDVSNKSIGNLSGLKYFEELKTLSCYGNSLASLDLTENPILLDAYCNGTRTEQGTYAEYSGGPLGGLLRIDLGQKVVTGLEPDHIPGDINGDGKVNNKDVTRLQRYLKGEETEVVEAALDVNGDGKVNNKDLTRLQRYLKGEEVEIY